MAAKLSVVFYILLCLEVGIVLTVLPWYSPFGLSDWGDNFFLLYAAQKTGLYSLQHAVASGWVRGAVTGLGLINLGAAVWEIAHFHQTINSASAPSDTSGKPLPETMPTPVAIWATSILSLLYFSIDVTVNGNRIVIAIPLGVLFMLWCWSLVARARRVCRARGIPLPSSYNDARIVAAVLIALNVLNAIRLMLI